jgi:hypothetical protein
MKHIFGLFYSVVSVSISMVWNGSVIGMKSWTDRGFILIFLHVLIEENDQETSTGGLLRTCH